ncbi:MAG: hypothetical protein CSH36_06335 [Thalassolituus sp.]|nr:MAG: hypothetical protein CSH36_06335 [Thalassolituus sp.]
MTAKSVGVGEYRVSSDYLILLTELAFERGISTATLLEGTHLPETFIFQPNIPVGHESALRMIDNFCERAGLDAALEYGKRMTLSKHGALGFAAQYSETMTDAAAKVERYIATRAQLFELEREQDSNSRHLYIRTRFPDSRAGYFLVLAFLSSVESICRALVKEENRGARSMLQIQFDGNFSGQTVLPNCSVYANSPVNCLTWPLDALEGMLPFFNPTLSTLADQELEQALNTVSETNTLAGRVREILNEHLSEMPTVEDVAGMLHMSAATLNRKLKAEQRSFQQIKDDLRYNKAQRLLRDTTFSVDQIADQLGYSDASNFAKAFKTWSGNSPSQYRQQSGN